MAWVRIDGSEPKPPGGDPYRQLWVTGGVSSIERHWRNGGAAPRWFLTMFAAFWNFVVAGAFIAAANGSGFTLNGQRYTSFSDAAHNDPTAWLFPAIFPLVGMAVAYLALAFWINRTRITVDGQLVSIARGPLPWSQRRVEIAASRIRQPYVEKYVSHTENDRPIKAFRVMAQIVGGDPIVIDKGMGTYQDAHLLEQWMEQQLHIHDVPVEGEVRGG